MPRLFSSPSTAAACVLAAWSCIAHADVVAGARDQGFNDFTAQLRWARMDTPQDGQAQGYRLATVADVQAMFAGRVAYMNGKVPTNNPGLSYQALLGADGRSYTAIYEQCATCAVTVPSGAAGPSTGNDLALAYALGAENVNVDVALPEPVTATTSMAVLADGGNGRNVLVRFQHIKATHGGGCGVDPRGCDVRFTEEASIDPVLPSSSDGSGGGGVATRGYLMVKPDNAETAIWIGQNSASGPSTWTLNDNGGIWAPVRGYFRPPTFGLSRPPASARPLTVTRIDGDAELSVILPVAIMDPLSWSGPFRIDMKGPVSPSRPLQARFQIGGAGVSPAVITLKQAQTQSVQLVLNSHAVTAPPNRQCSEPVAIKLAGAPVDDGVSHGQVNVLIQTQPFPSTDAPGVVGWTIEPSTQMLTFDGSNWDRAQTVCFAAKNPDSSPTYKIGQTLTTKALLTAAHAPTETIAISLTPPPTGKSDPSATPNVPPAKPATPSATPPTSATKAASKWWSWLLSLGWR